MAVYRDNAADFCLLDVLIFVDRLMFIICHRNFRKRGNKKTLARKNAETVVVYTLENAEWNGDYCFSPYCRVFFSLDTQSIL